MSTATSYGIDPTLITNLCGRDVRPNPDRWAGVWAWAEDYAVRPETFVDASGAICVRLPDGTTRPIKLEDTTYPKIAEARAEIVAVYRRDPHELRLKIANRKGQIADVGFDDVALVTLEFA